MYSLHDGGGADRRVYDGWRSHGVGHRLNGRLWHLALHGNQDWLVVEGGAYQGAGDNCFKQNTTPLTPEHLSHNKGIN